jgi:hypothetical protein
MEALPDALKSRAAYIMNSETRPRRVRSKHILLFNSWRGSRVCDLPEGELCVEPLLTAHAVTAMTPSVGSNLELKLSLH